METTVVHQNASRWTVIKKGQEEKLVLPDGWTFLPKGAEIPPGYTPLSSGELTRLKGEIATANFSAE
jgi:hypothetical protein